MRITCLHPKEGGTKLLTVQRWKLRLQRGSGQPCMQLTVDRQSWEQDSSLPAPDPYVCHFWEFLAWP